MPLLAFALAACGNADTPDPNTYVRSQILALATTLDNYNNGLVGPGHCDE